ncbi:hypothetical protein [Pandoraea sputorum]|nr:hypothetical protein [Pandoraea sputorum]
MLTKEFSIGPDELRSVHSAMKALYFPSSGDPQSRATAPITLCLNGKQIVDRMLEVDPYLLERDAGAALLLRLADKIVKPLIDGGTPKPIAQTMALDIASMLASGDFVNVADEVCPANSTLHERFINVVTSPGGVVFEMTTTFRSTAPTTAPTTAPQADPSSLTDMTAKLTKRSGSHDNSLDETAASVSLDPHEPVETAARVPIDPHKPVESARDGSTGSVALTMVIQRAVQVTTKSDAPTATPGLSARCVDVRVFLDNRLGSKTVHEEAQRLGAPGDGWIGRWLARFLEPIVNFFRFKHIAFEIKPAAQPLAPNAAPQPAPLGGWDPTEFVCFSAQARGSGWEHERTRYGHADNKVLRNGVVPATPPLKVLREVAAQDRIQRFVKSGLAATEAQYHDVVQNVGNHRTVAYEGKTLAAPTYPYGPLLVAQAGIAAARDKHPAPEGRTALEERVYHAFKKNEAFIRVNGEDAMPYEAEDIRNARAYVDALNSLEDQTEKVKAARNNRNKGEESASWFSPSEKTLQDAHAATQEELLLDCESALNKCATALGLPEGASRSDQIADVKAKLLAAVLAQIKTKIGKTEGLPERLVRLLKHGPDATRTLIGQGGPRFPNRDAEQLVIHIDTHTSEYFPAIDAEPDTLAVTMASGCATLEKNDTVEFGREKLDASTVDASTSFTAYWLVYPSAGVKLNLVQYDAKFAPRQPAVSTSQRAVKVEHAAVSQHTATSKFVAQPAALEAREPGHTILEPHKLLEGRALVEQAQAAAQADPISAHRVREALAERVYQAFEQQRSVVEINGEDGLVSVKAGDVRKVRAYMEAVRDLERQTEITDAARHKAEDKGFFTSSSTIAAQRDAYETARKALVACQTTLQRCLIALDLSEDLAPSQHIAAVKDRLLSMLLTGIERKLRDTSGAWAKVSALLLYGAHATHDLIYGRDGPPLPDRAPAPVVFSIFTKASKQFPGIVVKPDEVALTIRAAGPTAAQPGTVKPGSKVLDAKAGQDPSTVFNASWLVSSEQGLTLKHVEYNAQFERRPERATKSQSTVNQKDAAVAANTTTSERDKQLEAFETRGRTRGDENLRALQTQMQSNGHAALQANQVGPRPARVDAKQEALKTEGQIDAHAALQANQVGPRRARGDAKQEALKTEGQIDGQAALEASPVSAFTHYGPMLVAQASATARSTDASNTAFSAEASALAESLWLQCVQPNSDAYLRVNGKDPLADDDNEMKTLHEYAQALHHLARMRAANALQPPTTRSVKAGAKASQPTAEEAETLRAAQATANQCAPTYRVQNEPLETQIQTVKARLYEKVAQHIRNAFPDEDVQKRIFEVLWHGRYATSKVIQGNGGPLFGPTHARADRITIDTSRDVPVGAAASATITRYSHDTRHPEDAAVLIGNGVLDGQTIAMHRSLSEWRVSAQVTELLHVKSRMQCVGSAVVNHRAWRAMPDTGLDRDEPWRIVPDSGLNKEARQALRTWGTPKAQKNYEQLLHREEVRWDKRLGVNAHHRDLGTGYLQAAGTLDTWHKELKMQRLRTLGRHLLMGCMRNRPFLRVNDVDILAGLLTAPKAKRATPGTTQEKLATPGTTQEKLATHYTIQEKLATHYAKRPPSQKTLDQNVVHILAKEFAFEKEVRDLPLDKLTARVEERLVEAALTALRQEVTDERTCELVIAAVLNGPDAMHCVIQSTASLDWSDPDSEQSNILICTRAHDALTEPDPRAPSQKINVKVPKGDVVIRFREDTLGKTGKGKVRIGDNDAGAVFFRRHLAIGDVTSTMHVRIHDRQMAMEHGRFIAKLKLTEESAEVLNPREKVEPPPGFEAYRAYGVRETTRE